MTTLREAAQAVLDRWDSPKWEWHQGPTAALMADLRAALAEPDLSLCPRCGGPADNGHDREEPPNPYYCTKCMAEPVQEPVAWMHTNGVGHVYFRKKPQDRVFNPQPLYTAPPQRKPLTDEEIEKAYQHIWRNLPDGFDFCSAGWIEQGIRYAEQAHGVTPPQISGDKEPYDPLPHSLEPEEGYEVGPSGRFIG